MTRIDDSVVTAQVLEDRLGEGERQVEISPWSKLTPSAQDYLKERRIEIVPNTAPSRVGSGASSGSLPASTRAAAGARSSRWRQ